MAGAAQGRQRRRERGPTALSPPFLRVRLRPENLSSRGYIAKSHSRLCGAENTREKRALRRAGIRRGNSLPEGEIDAIVTVIELDIISITIIIISIIITAISTAAPRHRCNNSAYLPNNDLKVEQCASIALAPSNPLQQHLENSESEAFREERDELDEIFLRQPILKHDLPVEDLGRTPPPKEDPVFDLKPLPDNIKYAHIDDKKIYHVIISSKLSEFEEERLLEILKKHRGAIGYTLDDLKGISPSICAINMEDDAKPVVEHQRRLIPKMKDVGIECALIIENLIRRMPFGLCNSPATFQRCMSAIFHGFCESIVERCEETNLVLNWEKCHFMVNEGIVLGHKISERGIEVDRAKVEAIEKMLYPRDVKDRKGADNPVADNLSRLENIAYDPVPVNDSFPNEQLAVIKGPLPPALGLDSFPVLEEALRTTDEFCGQYRALRREVEILQEENYRLRRMLEYYSIPITRVHREATRLCGAENTKEKRALRRAGTGKFPPEGEIDAIITVIELDIISITIVIISIIITAISTAAPRHRCNNSGWILIV
ncbi:hypothetical protein QYE76_060001 [Lolium multiflorum]|uniref:Uncharacterized protein n=1 Tax=Lolium multiflorum TaxID=4521 RepID=A0AAD8W3E3_LOLMU|nr:hypothetical protein QYE76_060001 [Lolium multiflorum]